MDDQQSYLLNGLLTRQFDVGRIIRFRHVPRGAQAITYEFLTAEQREFLVQLFPPAFSADRLAFVATTLNALDAERFSVLLVIPTKSGEFVAEGPQGTHLMLSLGAAGSDLAPAHYSAHDVSQVGLRLAWMHRLLRERVPLPSAPVRMVDQLNALFDHPTAESARAMPALSPALRATLLSILEIPIPFHPGWAHGHFQARALLHDGDHQLRAIVDWGLLHFGSPLEDVVDAFLSICVTDDGSFLPHRGRVLREAYESLVPLKEFPWTPLVGMWFGQRLLDASQGLRKLPPGFFTMLAQPERLAVALATCR